MYADEAALEGVVDNDESSEEDAIAGDGGCEASSSSVTVDATRSSETIRRVNTSSMKYCKTTTVTPRPQCRDDKIREGCTARAGCSRCSRAPCAPQTHRAVLHYGARVRLRAPRVEKSRALTPPASCVSVAGVHRRDSAPHTPTRCAAAPL